MKFTARHIGRFLFSLVFLLALGNRATAFESWIADAANQHASLEEESEQNRSKEFDVLSRVKAAQTISIQEYSGVGWLTAHRSGDSIVLSELFLHRPTVYYVEDQRRSIARYSYPFHFHW